jgi:hypothetical protein
VSETGYVAFIDEAGDFGLKKVVPLDERGASEWFVVGAVLVRKENEPHLSGWLKAIRDEARNNQPTDLHFRRLNDKQKRIVCLKTSELPLRLFVAISNKQNMKGHKNHSASNISKHKHWFYWWMTRLLLERVSGYCGRRNARDNTPGRKLRVEFSRRKDLREHGFTDYFTRLWGQGRTAYLNKRTIDWDVFDFQAVEFHDHASRAGLQFADILASSFFQAINLRPDGTCTPDYARLLTPIICLGRDGKPFDEGFTVMPTSLRHLTLDERQIEVFQHFGLPEDRMPRRAARGQSPRS